MSNEKIPIQCGVQNGKQGRPPLLAKMDTEGIFLWCKVCHTEHRISRSVLLKAWDELDAMQSQVVIVETKVQCIYKYPA